MLTFAIITVSGGVKITILFIQKVEGGGGRAQKTLSRNTRNLLVVLRDGFMIPG